MTPDVLVCLGGRETGRATCPLPSPGAPPSGHRRASGQTVAVERVPERAVAVLPSGGRIVVHGVTGEAEEVCVAAYRRWGGLLARLQHEHAAPIGRLLGETPARAVVSWAHVVAGAR